MRGRDYTVDTAREAARREELADWVARFLASPGSDNAALAEDLCEKVESWIGPVRLPLEQLHRLAGPPGHPVLCPVDEERWDDRVESIEEVVEDGGDLPPVIVVSRGDQLVLEDGNHRVEGIRQAGRRTTWAVVGFEDERDRARFLSERGSEP